MEVFINNSSSTISEESSLFRLLELNDLQEKKGIAVAVNNNVVPRSQWTSHVLCAGDKVTVIKATQGG